MFHKILWATDGSADADRALESARQLAAANGSSVIAVHTVEVAGGPHSPAVTEDPEETDTQAKIARQVHELVEQGLAARSTLVEAGAGGAAHAIADVAKNEGADLIVVGTRGHTPLAGLLVGSVTQRLLHIAPCPILVIPRATDTSS